MTGLECTSLNECPWQQLSIGGQDFIVKCFKKKSTCELFVSDLVSSWYEKIDAFGVLDTNARLNPSIETSADRLLLHLVSIFDNNRHHDASSIKDNLSPKFVVVTKTRSKMQITCESLLCSEPFSWEFNLIKRSDIVLSEHLTKPLMSMVVELSRRQQELVCILLDKDAQIADYKAEGVKIPTRHQYETPFDETTFTKEMIRMKEFHTIATATDNRFNRTLQDLYTAVMNARSHQEEQNYSSNDSTVQQSHSGAKSVAINEVDAGSVKELELQRRQTLQSRLAEEQTRKETQNKTKKLKL